MTKLLDLVKTSRWRDIEADKHQILLKTITVDELVEKQYEIIKRELDKLLDTSEDSLIKQLKKDGYEEEDAHDIAKRNLALLLYKVNTHITALGDTYESSGSG